MAAHQRRRQPTGARIKANITDWKGLLLQSGVFVLFVMYMELVFRLMTVGGMASYALLMAVPAGILIAVLGSFFPAKANRAVLWTLLGLLELVFSVQLVYYQIFQSFLSWGMAAMGGQVAGGFAREGFQAIWASLPRLLVLWLPLPALGVLMHYFRAIGRQRKALLNVMGIAVTLAAQLFGVLLLRAGGTATHSAHDLYHHTWLPDLSYRTLGVVTTTWKDVGGLLFGGGDGDILQPVDPDILNPSQPPSSSDPSSGEQPPAVEYNRMDIDFAGLAASETDEKIKELHQYFAAQTATKKNQYTGMFEGYNLIVICAEAFSPGAVSSELTPTLYRMTQEGFIFNNFYAMYPSVTTDGEYTLCTGLIPDTARGKTDGSFAASAKNYLPFCLGNQFNKLGLTTRAYHNYQYTYYNRHLTHPNMGYLYKAAGKGLPYNKSDLVMMQKSLPDFLNDKNEDGSIKQFHTYYMTVSGHLAYRFDYGNEIADKNREAVSHLPYSDNVKAYLSCNLELEYAMKYLLEQLEAAGVADKTVIAMTTDHYPYGLHLYEYSELMGYKVDEDFGKFKNHFILWNPGMEENIVVDTPCSTLDILPTISNLFGLEYDSRLMMGTDILSDAVHIAILRNQSFITDKVMYSSRTGETKVLTDEPLPDGYVDTIIRLIQNKFAVSARMLDTDYYATILKGENT